MKRKEIKFNDVLSDAVQTYADDNYEGNFNMTVRVLCSAGLTYFKNIKDKELEDKK